MRHLRLAARTGPLIIALLTAALLVAPTGATARPTTDPAALQLVDLGTLGGANSYATDINDRGEVVGYSTTASDRWYRARQRAFVWRDGRMKRLATLGGGNSSAAAINNWGDIVGNSDTADGDAHVFLWRNGSIIALTGLEGAAVDINDQGEVISTFGGGGFLWRDGNLTDLGAFIPEAINNHGQIVGTANFGGAYDAYDAAMWDHGVVTRLASPTGATLSHATDINDRGEIVGFSLWPNTPAINRATLWRDGVAIDLGGPSTTTQAWGINENGQIVGWREEGQDAVVWDHGVITALPTFGGWSAGAWAINDSGQVVGDATFSLDPYAWHAVLWR